MKNRPLCFLLGILDNPFSSLHPLKHHTVNPMCPTNDGIEDTEHIDIQRQDLLAGASELLRPFVRINTLPNNVLVQYLLYGNKELPDDVNKNLLELTLNFIHKTGRLG